VPRPYSARYAPWGRFQPPNAVRCQPVKYRLLTTFAATSLLLCILTGAFAVRSWSVEDWMARSRWELDGPKAREVSWTLASERGNLAVGRREIEVPTAGQLEQSYWEKLAEKPEYSWHAIRLAARREQRPQSLIQRLGFHTVDISQEGESGIAMTYRQVGLPHWFVALCLLVLPVWWVVLRRKHKRAKVAEQSEVKEQHG
jgi:hypothetical protein